jgi:hypothetical protein
MIWPLTFYTDFGVPDGSAGCARGPVIFIRPKYRNDYGLYRHELLHVKQAIAGFFVIHALFYLLWKPYRLWAEVQAYREQARHYAVDRLPKFASFIATGYGLDVTEAEALSMLRNVE